MTTRILPSQVPLLAVLLSPEIGELSAYTRHAPLSRAAEEANWFTLPSAVRVYRQFLQLDTDHDGMLTPEELVRFDEEQHSLTLAFCCRLFEVVQTPSQAAPGRAAPLLEPPLVGRPLAFCTPNPNLNVSRWCTRMKGDSTTKATSTSSSRCRPSAPPQRRRPPRRRCVTSGACST